MSKTISLHMIVDGEGFTNNVRQVYWWESKKRGNKWLGSLIPKLTKQQKHDLLYGEVRFIGVTKCDNPQCEQCNNDESQFQLEKFHDEEFLSYMIDEGKIKPEITEAELIFFQVYNPKTFSMRTFKIPKVLLENYLHSMMFSDFISKYHIAGRISTVEMVKKLQLADDDKASGHSRIFDYLNLKKPEMFHSNHIEFFFQEGLEKWCALAEINKKEQTMPKVIEITFNPKADRKQDEAIIKVRKWTGQIPKYYADEPDV